MDDDLRQIVKRVVGEALGTGQVSSPAPAPSTGTNAPPDPGRGPVALGADHGGYNLKEALKAHLEGQGYSVIDCGTHSTDSVDYPDFARAAAVLVGQGKAWRGIIVDGAGIGSSMAANKVRGVRASLCYDHATARNAREHNDANVLTLGAGLIGESLAVQIVDIWLATPFGGGRHARRVQKIMEMENLVNFRKEE
jgi:ribose 5-phosphate isomerase B